MPALKYDISVVGMQNVERALSHIEARVRQHNLSLVRSAASTGGSGRGTGPGVTEAQAARARQREEAEAKRAADRVAAHAVRAAEKAERDKTRAAQRETALRVAAEEKGEAYAQRLRMRYFSQQQRAEEKAARSQEAERKRADRAAERSEEKRTRDAEREARKRSAFQQRMAAEDERHHARTRARWASATGQLVGRGFSAVAGVGKMGLAMAGLAGGALFANAAHTYLKDSAAATSLANQMARSGESKEEIRSRRAGLLTNAHGVKGFTTLEALKAQRAFGGKAGDYEMGGKLLGGLSQVSLATDVELSDVAEVAANAYMKLSKTMKGKELEKATLDTVRTFAGQGNIGAVEIKDLAQYAGRITSAAGTYAGSRQKNMASLGAMAQIAIGAGAASDAAEATTTVERFSADLTRHSDKAEGMGVKVWADSSRQQKRGPEDVMVDVLNKTKGDQVKLKSIFGLESIKMVTGFADIWSTGEAKGAGGGEKAVRAEFERMTRASLSEKDAEARAAARLAEEDMIVAENMKKLNAEIGVKLVPSLITLTGQFARMTPMLGGFAEAISKTVAYLANLTGSGGKDVAGSTIETSNKLSKVSADPSLSPEEKARKKLEIIDAERSRLGAEESKARKEGNWGEVTLLDQQRKSWSKDRNEANRQLESILDFKASVTMFKTSVEQLAETSKNVPRRDPGNQSTDPGDSP